MRYISRSTKDISRAERWLGTTCTGKSHMVLGSVSPKRRKTASSGSSIHLNAYIPLPRLQTLTLSCIIRVSLLKA